MTLAQAQYAQAFCAVSVSSPYTKGTRKRFLSEIPKGGQARPCFTLCGNYVRKHRDLRSKSNQDPTDPKGRVGGVLCATKWYHSTRGGRSPTTSLGMGTPQSDTTKISRFNNLRFDGGRGRDKGLSGGGIHDGLSVEGGGVGGDCDFLFRDTVHSGEFMGSFDAVIRHDIIITDKLEEKGGEVDFKSIGVDGGGFFHLSADIEPIGVGLESVEGGFGGSFGALIDVHISSFEGAFKLILVSPDSEVAFLMGSEAFFGLFCQIF